MNILFKDTITGRINKYIFALLKSNSEGLQWKDLQRKIEGKFPEFHPKTINGTIWKLTTNYPDLVEKPERGLFRLID